MMLVWKILLCVLLFYFILYVIGFIVENKLSDNSAIKKFWRKHLVAPDPNEPEDGETRY